MVLEISFPTHKFQGALWYLICIVTLNGFIVTQETTALTAFVRAFLEKLKEWWTHLDCEQQYLMDCGLEWDKKDKRKSKLYSHSSLFWPLISESYFLCHHSHKMLSLLCLAHYCHSNQKIINLSSFKFLLAEYFVTGRVK